MDHFVNIKDVDFTYPGSNQQIYSDFNLSLDFSSTAIIGQNGGGKTTLVKLMKGLLKPNKGSVEVLGYDTKVISVADLSKHIGLVFQNPNDQIFKNTVIDEVMFGPLNLFRDKEKATAVAREALLKVDLPGIEQVNPYDLSLSQRKLIAIASILAMDTSIVIFDEPTIAQDVAGKKLIGYLIEELKLKGKLVITIAHDMDFVAKYFERVIVLKQGKIELDGSPVDVFSHKQVIQDSYLELPNVAKLSDAVDNRVFVNIDSYVQYCKSLLKV